MSLNGAFSLVSALALLGWLPLVFAPLKRALLIAAARGVAVALCAAYLLMLGAALLRPGGPAIDFNHLDALAHAFSLPAVMLVGWTHYLAFDLWTGAWEAEEAHRRGVPHWALLPCLVLTFLVGPVGLAAFLAVRAAFRGRNALAAGRPRAAWKAAAMVARSRA